MLTLNSHDTISDEIIFHIESLGYEIFHMVNMDYILIHMVKKLYEIFHMMPYHMKYVI